MDAEMDDEAHDHDRGLSFDVSTLLDRRRALTLLGGAGLVSLAACRPGSGTGTTTTSGATSPSTTSPSASPTTTAASGAACSPIPQETAGPYPGDGSNGANVLTQSGIVRRDITSSLGTASGVARGVPLTIKLHVVSVAQGCTPLTGAAVYLWHCDREGRYSMYSAGITAENYLRGVQETDTNGDVTFTSIFPAAYSGRWPHIHFEVYPSVTKATGAGTKLRTSQLALPEDVCRAVYATDGYASSVTNLARSSLSSDNVFSDGYSLQLATVTGSVAEGYTASLALPV
jgi:protocatechuate 3,4-dioxygenase beta subunit